MREKKIKYKCTVNDTNYDLGDNKYTWEEWKAIALGWFNQNERYALAANMRALSKTDVFKFLEYTCGLKFEQIGD